MQAGFELCIMPLGPGSLTMLPKESIVTLALLQVSFRWMSASLHSRRVGACGVPPVTITCRVHISNTTKPRSAVISAVNNEVPVW